MIPDHCKLHLSKDVARFLMEGFKKILDYESKPNRQLTEAYQQHIEDLRAITFRQMGIDESEETIRVLKVPTIKD